MNKLRAYQILGLAMLSFLSLATVCQATPQQPDLFLANDGASGANYGHSVAISTKWILVGAIDDEENGSAYLYDAATGNLIHKLRADDGADNDHFGNAVAISGNTIIVAAYKNDALGRDSGAVYIFDAATGLQTTKVTPKDGSMNDFFGYSVAIENDVLVVGSYQDDDFGSGSGSIYIFSASTGEQTAKLNAEDAGEGDSLGYSVAISGSLIIGGAPFDEVSADQSGSAYLFDLSSGTQVAKLVPDDGARRDWFGWSCDIDGTRAVVGAFRNSTNAAGAGAAYLFDSTSGTQIARLNPQDPEDNEQFGFSVAIDDGKVLVSAHQSNELGPDSGSAHLFDAQDGIETMKLLPADDGNSRRFGFNLALSGSKALCGTPGYSPNGAAFLFDLNTPSACTGDTNTDQVVDLADLNAVLAAFGQSTQPGKGADIDGSGTIDLQDLNTVLANFGTTCP